MSLTNPNKVVTEQRLNEYHNTILPYLGGNSMVACGGGYAPIGTIIAFMGTTAPSDFLACDGSVLNIADYTELADFFELQFGSANYFGGDGNTTFAVPDLRGEFLRGTGTNSHTDQGAGSNVGEHQDATRHPYFYGNSTGALVFVGGETTTSSGNDVTPANADTVKDGKNQRRITSVMNSTLTTTHKFYFSRPTNTSVLYCIKAVSDGYSTDEKIVGTWIDGKPLYKRTVVGTIPSTSGAIGVVFTDLNIDNFVSYSGMATNNINQYKVNIPNVWDSNYLRAFWEIATKTFNIACTRSDYLGGTVCITALYTKVSS